MGVHVACGCLAVMSACCAIPGEATDPPLSGLAAAGPSGGVGPARPSAATASPAGPTATEVAAIRGSAASSSAANSSDGARPARAASPRRRAAGSGAALDERARERRLRSDFADAAQPAAAAVELASFLAVRERHDEALHVLDLACARTTDPGLLLARAGVLRDLARCDLALVDLERYVTRRGRAEVAPSTLFELVQVAWLAGESVTAAQALRDLQRLHGATAWFAAAREEVGAWSRRVTDETPETDVGELRDVFAMLRGAPRGSDRLRLLERLAAPGAGDGGVDRQPVRRRAIAVACADPSAAVRARAIQLADADGISDRGFWLAAIRDESPLVRRFAAAGLVRNVAAGAVDALLAALTRERAPAPFRAIHTALQRATGVEFAAGAVELQQVRERVRARWREKCKAS